MSYSIEKIGNEPIIVNILHADFDFQTEAQASTREAIQLLEAQTEPVYYITDITAPTFTFEDTVAGSALAALGESPVFHHRNVKQVLLVVADDMQAMSGKGMQSKTYGNVNIETFTNIEDALASART